jgi:hypothetical protein
LPSDRANTSSTSSAGGAGSEDADQLRSRLGLVQPRELQALDRAETVQFGEIGSEPLLAGFVVAVGNYQQHPLTAQVTNQEGQQIVGGPVGPVQILHDQHKGSLHGQAPQQPQQQLEHSGSSRLLGRAGARLTQGGQQAGQLRPGRADQLTHRADADLGQQSP